MSQEQTWGVHGDKLSGPDSYERRPVIESNLEAADFFLAILIHCAKKGRKSYHHTFHIGEA
jgi:hypothetical protein